MQRQLWAAVLFLGWLTAFWALPPGEAAAAGPEITAASYIAVDARTGMPLLEKDADTARPMASLTKLLTGLLAVENSSLDERVEIPEDVLAIGGSRIYLEPGESFTVEELLYAMLLPSANDAALALALHVDGSVEAFARRMNERAEALGAEHSHFVNPHGLTAEGHRASARDLAAIGRAAMASPVLRRIVGTEEYRLVSPRMRENTPRLLHNLNRLLHQELPGGGTVIGGKTGYTEASGQTLVAAAEKDGREVVGVVLNSEFGKVWDDMSRLLDQALDSYFELDLVQKGEAKGEVLVAGVREPLPAAAADSVSVPLPAGVDAGRIEPRFRWISPLAPPVREGQKIGELSFWLDGAKLGETPLVAARGTVEAVSADASSGPLWPQGVAALAAVYLPWRIRLALRRRRRRRNRQRWARRIENL